MKTSGLQHTNQHLLVYTATQTVCTLQSTAETTALAALPLHYCSVLYFTINTEQYIFACLLTHLPMPIFCVIASTSFSSCRSLKARP